MEGDDAGIGHRDARAMLDAFASVGATRFDVTWTTCGGEKEWFRRGMSFDDLARNLPRMLDGGTEQTTQRDRAPAWPCRDVHPTRRPRPSHARPSRPCRVSHFANLAGEFPGMGCNRRAR